MIASLPAFSGVVAGAAEAGGRRGSAISSPIAGIHRRVAIDA
jgi:hypothetical protein